MAKKEKGIKMDKDNEQPLVRLKGPDGMAFYPRYHKNTEGEWELNDKSFSNLLRPVLVSEKHGTKMDKD